MAALKEEDLPSEDISTTAATTNISELHYCTVKLMLNCFNIGLSVRHLLTACRSVSDWHSLGVHLDLTMSQLDDIHVTYHAHGVERLKTEMFSVWLKSSPHASWTDLITALRAMDENTVASQIQAGTFVYMRILQ